jgi:hypothetical protein
MPPALNPEKALIFRITHRDNLGWILDNGLHASTSSVLDPNFKNVGNVDLINRRQRRIVRVGPGGTLSDYIPFYFTPYSIMLLNIHTGYNVPSLPNDEIVILVSSLRKITELDIPFVFTNQHAYPPMANYYTDLADLCHVPWDQLNRRDFKHDPDDPAKKERYQAEALIWKHMPVHALLGICCCTEAVNQVIQAAVAKRNLKLDTIVRRDWYFL